MWHLIAGIDIASWSDAAIASLRSLGWYGIPGDGCECLYPPRPLFTFTR